MTTPNVEELITYLQGLANEIEIPYPMEVIEEAAEVLQSQAEHIAELERESETHSKAYGLAIVERDNLRAQLAAIAATEPVLVVEKEPDYWSGGHFHEGSKSHIKSTKVWRLPVGTQLFTRPMPAQDATELVEALERVLNCCDIAECGTVPNSPGALKNARTALSKYKGAKL